MSLAIENKPGKRQYVDLLRAGRHACYSPTGTEAILSKTLGKSNRISGKEADSAFSCRAGTGMIPAVIFSAQRRPVCYNNRIRCFIKFNIMKGIHRSCIRN